MTLSLKDVKSLRLYITKRYGKIHYNLEPDDILNETILYLIERDKLTNSNIKYIASTTFYAIRNLKSKNLVIYKLMNSNIVKINEQIKEEILTTPFNTTYEKELQNLMLNYKKPEADKAKKRIICLTTGEEFDSMSKAAKKYGIDTSAIRKNIKKLTISAGKCNGVKLMWGDVK